MASTTPVPSVPSPLANVLRVTSGNFLEMYDFFLASSSAATSATSAGVPA